MALIDKLKKLFQKTTTQSKDGSRDGSYLDEPKKANTPHQNDTSSDTKSDSQAGDTQNGGAQANAQNPLGKPSLDDELPDYLSPITNHLEGWLKGCDWHYKRHNPAKDDVSCTHHLALSFGDKDYDWNCVMRISEKNQIITFYGVLLVDVPTSHYINLIAHLSEVNTNACFGNIEFDLQSGDLRVKMAVDAEFTELSDQALGTYMQGVSGLIDITHQIYHQVLEEAPLKNFDPIIKKHGKKDNHDNPSDSEKNDDEGNGYYAPTHTTQ